MKPTSDEMDISSDNYINNAKKVCFIHSCTINNWLEILYRQLERLSSSGLYNLLDTIFLNIATKNIEQFEVPKVLTQYNKVQLKITNDLERYERSTLEWLYEYIDSCTENVQILYFHTKGVSRYNTNRETNVKDWVNLMETVLIDNHHMCIGYLEETDTCGVNFLRSPSPHFSGNFWWANSDYIKKLNPKIGPNYLDPEFWILSNEYVKFCCIFHSNIIHYNEPFPSEKIPNSFQPNFYIINKNHIKLISKISN